MKARIQEKVSWDVKGADTREKRETDQRADGAAR